MDDGLPDDGLKWFGEGFDGFPKRLPEDCIEYAIHIVNERLQTQSQIRSRLAEISKVSNDLRKNILKDYIWQRDSFDLSIYPKPGLKKPPNNTPSDPELVRPYLRGRSNFGDSIADEWLVVYLLSEISKQFPDAWIRVYDTDGEFLLIEAANSLPKWLNPEIADNRVWLHDGRLKIVPVDKDRPPRNLALQEGLSLIRDSPEKLLTDPAIEKEAFYRLREYPSAISSSLHHALITIPRRLAYILHRNPAYISSAVESFYLRDPISLKPLASKDLHTLSFPPEDFVTVSVRFTKVGFAQLRSQPFDPPPSWTGILPRMQDEKVALGMKLACGFEMLVSDPQNAKKRVVQEIKLLLEDIDNGEEVLPTDAELTKWPRTQDDEKWLDIDYNDFEKELSGNGRSKENGESDGFGDQSAQQNLRKMVSRFQDFLEDDEAGAEGVGDTDEDDGDDEVDTDSNMDEAASVKSDDEEAVARDGAQAVKDEVAFEKAMKETRAMQEADLQKSGLLDEARRLALEDDEDASEVDEDEEMRKVMELMEKELKDHGALNLEKDGKAKVKSTSTPGAAPSKPFFGPERPPNLQPQSKALAKKSVRFEEAEEADEEIDPGDGELSSDDEEFNDVDLGLAKNMLESFKGQVGMAGPAGNLMKALGVNMPRDEEFD